MKNNLILLNILAFLVFSAFILNASEKSQLRTFESQPPGNSFIQQDTTQTKQVIEKFLTRGPKKEIRSSSETLRLNIPFDFNSADLTPSAKHQLDELAAALQSPELSETHIELSGHTDKRGSVEYNENLSQRRVESAKSYLVKKHNVSQSRILAQGYGESRPIKSGAKSEAEHAINRRVAIRRIENKIDGVNKTQEDDILSEQTDVEVQPQTKSLGFQWGVFQIIGNDKHELIQYDGTSTLSSHDAYRIYLHPNSQCYVYIYQVDSQGNGAWLFPSEDVSKKNPLKPRDAWIPSRNHTFVLDETVGTESIYLVATQQPATDLEAIIDGSKVSASEEVTAFIKTRGLGEIRLGPRPDKGQDETISLLDTSNKKKRGVTIGPRPEDSKSASVWDIAEIMSQMGEFFVVLKFKHE